MSSSRTSREFNHLVLEAIDEGLSILGDDPVKRAFYYHLKKRANIKRTEIPDKLKEFHEALADLFFDGSIILERRISRHLYERLGLELPTNDGWTIADYVKEACAKYESA
jgi:hypothetical protein